MDTWQYFTLGAGLALLFLYFRRRSARLGRDE
jgi:hypothetical protein